MKKIPNSSTYLVDDEDWKTFYEEKIRALNNSGDPYYWINRDKDPLDPAQDIYVVQIATRGCVPTGVPLVFKVLTFKDALDIVSFHNSLAKPKVLEN